MADSSCMDEVFGNSLYIEEFDAVRIDLKSSSTQTLTSNSKYPAKQHARSVAAHLGVKEGLIYLLGRPLATIEDSDQPKTFRQRRYFYYMSGVDFPDCVITYDIGQDLLCLFVPPAKDPRTILYNGTTPGIEECRQKYDVDEVRFREEINAHVTEWLRLHTFSGATIYVLHPDQSPRTFFLGFTGRNSINLKQTLDTSSLQPAMDAARVIKSAYEIELIRKANDISSSAHKRVLSVIRDLIQETQIEAVFEGACLAQGAKKQAYSIIAASGENASTLHYMANNESLKGRQLVCIDAGCEWDCYAADITRTFPLSGSFSKEAKEVYSIVQEMQDRCIGAIKPGVMYRDLQNMAMDIAVTGLLKLGILHNGSFKEVRDTGIAFFPHGLGHHIGLEVHDVSGKERLLLDVGSMHDLQQQPSYIAHHPGFEHKADRRAASGPRKGEQILQTNMVVTIEPGIYFNRYGFENVWFKDPKHARYINKDALENYYSVGGVRIEDDILVTEDGYENLTTAPKGEEACKIIRDQGWQWI